jgi:hypothetical protein
MSEETYGAGRARNLEQMLRMLSARIAELDASGRLLASTGELTRLIGDVKSELFHYEVRVTYDTPEVANNRRVVADAINQQEEESWRHREWKPEEEEDPDR